MCFDLKAVIGISIIFHMKLLECEREDARKGQENKADCHTRKLLVFLVYWSYLYNAYRSTMSQKKNLICTFIFNFVQCALSFLGQFLTVLPLLTLWVVVVNIKLASLWRFLPFISDMADHLRNKKLKKHHLFIPFNSIVYSTNVLEHILGSMKCASKVLVLHSPHNCGRPLWVPWSPVGWLSPKRLSIRWSDLNEPEWALSPPRTTPANIMVLILYLAHLLPWIQQLLQFKETE